MRKKLFTVILIATIIGSINYGIVSATEEPEPFFYINLLAPNTSSSRIVHPTLMCEQLPKIGIGVEIFDHTGWSQITPRTWGYPGPYPIPPYPDGGYDVLFVGWNWGTRWNPEGLFDSNSITPVGGNFYQYSNPDMDEKIKSLSHIFNESERLPLIKDIQAILYYDLPSITFFYPYEIFPHNTDLEGFNATLWLNNYQFMINWSIPDQTFFNYAQPAYFEEFHPLICDFEYDSYWLNQIYNGLFERNPSNTGAYIPWLAESICSDDGLVYYITIKSDAVWADGTAITTDDIIYNYQLAVTKNTRTNDYYEYIKYWDNSSITKINDKEFTFTFKERSIFHFDYLGLNLIPKHIWENIPPSEHRATAENWVLNQPEKMFGAGPFVLEKFNFSSHSIHLIQNPYFDDWFGRAPKFSDVFFLFYISKEAALSALSKREVDMVDSGFVPSIIELDEQDLDYSLANTGAVQEMAINMLHPYLGTGESCPIASEKSALYIRKAISFIIPREVICEEVYYGAARPGITPCPPATFGFDNSFSPFEYNIALALQYMQLAGFDISAYNDTKVVIGFDFVFYLSVLGLLGARIILKRNQK
ncbi:MAG: ABC transporter substrate-binding protein [Candidatus Thorarchaeota archaeon]